MGVFERIINRDDNVYSRIKNNIKNNKKLLPSMKNKFIEYVSKIESKEINNDFFDEDFLERAIIGFIDKHDEHDNRFIEEEWKTLLKVVRKLLPFGTKTSDYEEIKELIINNLLEVETLINEDITNDRLFAIITNKRDYINIMNIILSYGFLKDRYEDICNLAFKLAPYMNEEQVRNYILYFIENYDDEDIDKYIEGIVEEAKLRVGIPMIDEKSIALISSEVKRARSLIATIEVMEKNVARYKNEVEAITSSGEKRLLSIVDDKVKGIISELDEYLIKLEESMRNNANQAFNQIMESAAEKIKEIRMSALEITNVTTSEMIRLRGVSDEIVRAAKTYIEDDPKVRELVAEASKDSLVKDAIISMKKSSSEGTKKVEVVNSGERVITSAPTIVISDTDLVKELLPLYNQDIPFAERFAIYINEKTKRMNGGRHSRKELFHEKSDEAAKCIMENDWLYGYGPSGSGKSKTIYQLADIFNTDIIPNGKITDKYSLMAYNDPHGNFRPTPAYLAVKEGKILLLDEFDNGNPDTQVLLNELYSAALDVQENPKKPRYVYFGENIMVRVHPNFRLVSLGNTTGEGENELYSSRSKIDESVIERMTPKFFDYDAKLEEEIFGTFANWREFARKFRRACLEWAKKEGLTDAQGVITTRDAAALARYARNNSKTLQEVLAEKFIQTKANDYLLFIMKKIMAYYEINEAKKFNYPKDIGKIREQDIAKALVLEIKRGTGS